MKRQGDRSVHSAVAADAPPAAPGAPAKLQQSQRVGFHGPSGRRFSSFVPSSSAKPWGAHVRRTSSFDSLQRVSADDGGESLAAAGSDGDGVRSVKPGNRSTGLISGFGYELLQAVSVPKLQLMQGEGEEGDQETPKKLEANGDSRPQRDRPLQWTLRRHHKLPRALSKHEESKCTLSALSESELRQRCMVAVAGAGRQVLLNLLLFLQSEGATLAAAPREMWLTVMGEDFWKEVFSYLELSDIIHSVSLVCVTWHRLIFSGDAFGILSAAGMEDLITDAVVSKLATTWRSVRHLDLSGCVNISSVTLQSIATHCHLLKSLSLAGCFNITSSGVQQLVAHNLNLKRISLSLCQRIDDDALATMDKLKKLYVLELDDTAITDQGLKLLKIATLQYISLNGCPFITDLGIRELANSCPNLMHVRMEMVPEISDQALQYLAAGCSQLRTLSVPCDLGRLGDQSSRRADLFMGSERSGEPRITDIGLTAVAKGCASLVYLDLSGRRHVSDKALERLSQNCLELEDVLVAGCPQVGDSGVKAIIKHCTKLHSLNIARCPRVTNSVLKVFGGLTLLRSVNLQGCSLGDDSVVAMAKHCPGLLEVCLRGLVAMTDAALAALGEHCQGLQAVDLGECSNVTDHGLRSLLSGLHRGQLSELYMDESPKLTDVTLQLVGSLCPNVHQLVIGGSSFTDQGLLFLATCCRSLETLVIRHQQHVTGEAMGKLATACRRLTTLAFESCHSISQSHLDELLCENSHGHPTSALRVLWLYDCPQLLDTEELRMQTSSITVAEGRFDPILQAFVALEDDEDSIAGSGDDAAN